MIINFATPKYLWEKQYIPVPHQIICTTKNIYFCDTKHSCDTKCSSVPHPSTYVAKNTGVTMDTAGPANMNARETDVFYRNILI